MARIFFLLYCILLSVTVFAQNTDSLSTVLQFHITIKDSTNIVRTVKPLANALREEKKYEEASQHLHATIEYAGNEDRLNLLNLLGQTYIEMSDYDSAMSQYKQLLRESEESKNLRYQGFALNNIAYIYYQNDDLEKASKYHHMALEVRLKSGEEKRIGTSYNNIGLIFFHQDSLEQSLRYYELALEMFREANYGWAESNVLNNIGNVYLKLGDYKQAHAYHKMGLDIRKRDEDHRGIAESFKNIARIYIRESSFVQAEQAIEKGMHSALQVDSKHLIKEFYLLRYEMAEEKGDFEEALERYTRYTQIKDSLTGLESLNRIAELEIQYETVKKEQHIQVLEWENMTARDELRNRTIFFAALVVVFILALVILILFVRQNRLKASLRIEQQKQRLLRSQMNPHFMYNALSAIQNFILQNNPMDSVSYIADFSGLMRLVLEGSRSESVSLADDIRLVQSYLKLQQLRFSNAFEFQLNIGNDIITELMSIPPMLLQPFIENAVEHGMRTLTPGTGHISILYERKDSNLQVTISDNGPGIKEGTKSSKHRSLATTITRERLGSIKKTQGVSIQMEISSIDNEGTKVVFIIPQKNRSK